MIDHPGPKAHPGQFAHGTCLRPDGKPDPFRLRALVPRHVLVTEQLRAQFGVRLVISDRYEDR